MTDEAGIDQLHACGGNARCTTCRVEFVAGEPDKMTVAEKSVLAARGLSGVRLSCQILCDHDMSVRAISRFAGSGRKDAGYAAGRRNFAAAGRVDDQIRMRRWPQADLTVPRVRRFVSSRLSCHCSCAHSVTRCRR